MFTKSCPPITMHKIHYLSYIISLSLILLFQESFNL